MRRAPTKCPIASRAMPHVVEVQQWTDTGPDSRGQPTGAWATVEKQRAAIRQLRTRESLVANQHYQQASHHVTTRYTSAITAGTQLIFGARTFHVLSVNNVDEMGTWLEITCSEAT